MTRRDTRLRLPHGETDPAKTYSMSNPDATDDACHTVRYWVFGHAGQRPEHESSVPTEALKRVLAMAEDYEHLTTYALGQEHCVAKLRDIWRARRARAAESEAAE